MRNYIILNEKNSNTIAGLLISTLPPITKPKIRTQVEEIDGRDGDIVTKLGYSAYEKEFEIGLYGEFDINEIISYFNTEGTVTFSNEPDKYYKYEIIDQIDFEKLIRFKTASIKMHVQPFKYPLEETPVEITIQNVTATGETMSLNNTADAPLKIDLKGNTSQKTTTGRNLINPNSAYTGTSNGITTTYNQNQSLSFSGTLTNTFAFLTNKINLSTTSGDYTFSINKTLNYTMTIRMYYDTTNYKDLNIQAGQTYRTTDFASDIVAYQIYLGNATSGTQINDTLFFQLEKGSQANNWEKYTGGIPAPNPDYPEEVETTTGGQEVDIVGKNLFDKSTISSITNGTIENDIITSNAISSNYGGVSANISGLKLKAGTYYISTKVKRVSGTSGNKLTRITLTGVDSSLITMIDNPNITNEYQTYSCSITTNEDVTLTNIGIQLQPTNVDAVMSYTDIMVSKDSNTTYEAYQSQSYEINLGKNLFYLPEASSSHDITYSINNDGTVNLEGTATNNAYFTTYEDISDSELINGGTYTWSSNKALPSGVEVRLEGYNGTTWVRHILAGNVLSSTNQKLTGTVNLSGATRVRYTFYVNSGSQIDISDLGIQLERGSTQTTFSKQKEPIELCKIGDYQDKIYKNEGTWYLYKEIGKVVLNGSQNYAYSNAFGAILYTDSSIANVDRNTTTILSNKAKGIPIFNLSQNNGIAQNDIANRFLIKFDGVSSYNTNELIKQYFTGNNYIVYYALAEPTTTEITDSELIAQLEAIITARSYDPVTNISQNTVNKPFILDAIAVQKGSDTGIVTNEGNIYSKPTIEIEGTGIAELYLDGNQIFNIDLSTINKCVIDTANLEAYNPETSQLMNRQVTGDYNNFKLNTGNNQVKISGEISKAKISNYTRWL